MIGNMIKRKLSKTIGKTPIGMVMNKVKGGPGDPEREIMTEEVKKRGASFSGPFSRMKAKAAIRRGETDFAVANKKTLKGEKKQISFVDSFNAADAKRGLNAPRLAKKKIGDKVVKETKAYKRYNRNKAMYDLLQD
jgi:hypothetical protein